MELLDEQGNFIAKSKTISEDSIDIPVQWKKETKLPPTALLKISISNARLYSIWAN